MSEQVDLLVRRLSDEGDAMLARLASVTPEQWDRPLYAAGQVWRGRDVLAHLVAAERGHQRIIASVARGGSGAPASLDVDGYNASSVADLAGCTALELLSDLRTVRDDTIALVRSLSDDDLERHGRHPVLGEDAPLLDMIRIVTMHVKMHLRDLNRILK
jgi:hypothetical protein